VCSFFLKKRIAGFLKKRFLNKRFLEKRFWEKRKNIHQKYLKKEFGKKRKNIHQKHLKKEFKKKFENIKIKNMDIEEIFEDIKVNDDVYSNVISYIGTILWKKFMKDLFLYLCLSLLVFYFLKTLKGFNIKNRVYSNKKND